MKKNKSPRKQKTIRTVTDAVRFKGMTTNYSHGFSLKMRLWKKVRGSNIMDIHEMTLILPRYELLTLHTFIQEAIKEDLEANIYTAKQFGVTP